jgi:transposase
MKYSDFLFELPKPTMSETETNCYGKPRLRTPTRNQIEIHTSSLDQLISEDHLVRQVWKYVERLDLAKILNRIKATEGHAGRSATDPKILVTLWLYATIEGIGSARIIGRYCKEHLAFQWICGGIEIDRKTISDFRTENGEIFDDFLAQGVAVLIKADIVKLEEVAQDSMKVRASAGKHTFRREKTLKELYQLAKEHVTKLKQELEDDSTKSLTRQQAAKKRAAEEKLNRLDAALKEMKVYRGQIDHNKTKHKKKKLSAEERAEIRVSTTDPEARNMKMAGGDFRPAYSLQYAIDVDTGYIVGSNVVNAGTDGGQILPMFESIKGRYKTIPKRYLADGGFKNKTDITALFECGCEAYIPLPRNKKLGQPLLDPKESEAVIEWQKRMCKEESKKIYHRRASSIEWFNAGVRRRGLYQLILRGIENVKIIASMHAVVHNMLISISNKLF